EAFNEMLVSFRPQMPFTRIPNPYVVGNPIRKADMFFGRQDDLEWIKAYLGYAKTAAENILKFYDQYYSIKYPFRKLDISAFPDVAAGVGGNFVAAYNRHSFCPPAKGLF